MKRPFELHVQSENEQSVQGAQLFQSDLAQIGINLKVVGNIWSNLTRRPPSPTPRPTCGCIGCGPISSIPRTGSARCTTASSTAPGRRRPTTRTPRSTRCCARRAPWSSRTSARRSTRRRSARSWPTAPTSGSTTRCSCRASTSGSRAPLLHRRAGLRRCAGSRSKG